MVLGVLVDGWLGVLSLAMGRVGWVQLFGATLYAVMGSCNSVAVRNPYTGSLHSLTMTAGP